MLTIILMAAVTYGCRVLPLLLFKKNKFDGIFKDIIELVPIALLAALVIPDLFVTSESEISLFNPFLLAAVCTFIFARYVPNLLLSILVGMISFWGLDKII